MKFIFSFVLRWIVTSIGLWVAIQLFGTGEGTPNIAEETSVILTAGLILSLANIFIKPLVFLISLPITILTLGLFTIVINGLMVYFALSLTPGSDIALGNAIIASIVIGIVNFIINFALDGVKAVK